MIRHDNKRGQIVIHAPQTIADPGSHAGKSRHLKAGRLQQCGGTMNARFADKVMDEGHLIDDASQWRTDLGQAFAGLTVRLPFPG